MAGTEYMAAYERDNLRQVKFKINRKTEPELLEWVEKQENIQGYIKQLIRKDMEKGTLQAELRGTQYWCPKCKNHVDMMHAGEFTNYCSFCGQNIKF